MTRAIRRLAVARHQPTCSVLNLAPTGAAAIAMSSDGCTIDSTCLSIVLRNSGASGAASASASANQLKPERLAKLRAIVGGSPSAFTLRLLLIDEQSMVNLLPWYSIVARLTQAAGDNLQHMLSSSGTGGSLPQLLRRASIVIAGDPGQLPCVRAKALDTPPIRTTMAAERHSSILFRATMTNAIVLDEQMRLNVEDEADVRLQRLQRHAYDGKLDNDDLKFISSRVFTLLPPAEQARLSRLRTFTIWARNAHVRLHNGQAICMLSNETGVPVADVLAIDKGSKHTVGDTDLGQMPGRTQLVPGLDIVVTANGGGHPDLTRPLGIANGSRGTVVATLYAPGVGPPELPQAVVVDLPSCKGPPLALGWPATWAVITPVEKRCEAHCCSRKGLALQPGANVTVFKCQGITCGECEQCQRVHVTFHDKNDPQQMSMFRAFFVAITRVRRARDLTFETGVTLDFLQRINYAKWRPAFDVEQARVRAMHDSTLARVHEHVTDEGWVTLLRLLDTCAGDGVHDAECGTPAAERAACAADRRCGAAGCTWPTRRLSWPQPAHRPSALGALPEGRSRSSRRLYTTHW